MANNFDPTVAWSDDEVGGTAKLNAMAQNDNILYNLIPHFMYNHPTDGRIDFQDGQTSVLKPVIYAGRISTSLAGRYGRTVAVRYPAGTFAPGCKPVVLCQIAGGGNQRWVSHSIVDLDGGRLVRNGGFQLQIVNSRGQKFTGSVSVHYMAFGWQEA